jgi:hypothetical protein
VADYCDNVLSSIMAQGITVEVDNSAFKAKKSSAEVNTLVGSIDQGTSSTRFLVFTPEGEVAAWAQMEHKQIFPEGEEKVSRFPL